MSIFAEHFQPESMNKKVLWTIEEEIAKQVKCDLKVTENLVGLLEKENSVPFIARYRKHQTGCMEPEKIREIKEKMDELKKVENEALKAIRLLEKTGNNNVGLEKAILTMTNLSLLKDLTSSLKPEARTCKFKAAFEIKGLEEAASQIVNCENVCLSNLVQQGIKGVSTFEEMSENLSYVLADKISKERETFDFIIQKCDETNNVFIISKKINSKKIAETVDINKFQEFFDFKVLLCNIKPHKYLAMKRGENLNVLKTSLELKRSLLRDFTVTLEKRFVGFHSPKELINKSLNLAYEKIVLPQIISKFRNDIKKTSEHAALSSFCSNLKQLLMTQPVRNKHILGVDPGYKHGCKFALISPSGDVLETGVIYLAMEAKHTPPNELNKLKSVLNKHRCSTVAIGNGMGCRSTEEFFSYHIKMKSFAPLEIVFSIVQESGASVYSASDLAKKELPDLDVTIRGAVSIARRLQDPLNELIKIDPKNLGVGMYQHDISEAKLRSSLGGVIEDCVSLAGVDINLCNEITLQHIAGIGPIIAKNIIAKRNEISVFKNRRQLLSVPLIGEKKFQQCAGFLRINLPDQGPFIGNNDTQLNDEFPKPKRKLKPEEQIKSKKKKADDDDKINFFDKTMVHPESYELASELLHRAQVDNSSIGQECFIKSLLQFITNKGVMQLAKELNTSTNTLDQIIESLTKPCDEDIRKNYSQPLFRSSIREMRDICVGQELTGQVTNVTDFGAFVDIGVETSGFIHINAMGSSFNLDLGMRVLARVIKTDLGRRRIGLHLLRVL